MRRIKGRRMAFEDPAERRAYLILAMSFNAALVLCLAGLFAGMALRNEELVRETVLARARSLFEEIVLTRKWNSLRGGVYVLKGPGVESNPWLADPDIAAADGRVLTKRNPALMTREISELAENVASFRFRITSLRPVNPSNAPDPFERAALEGFERGGSETWARERRPDGAWFRYMGVLKADASCLACHAAQGYKAGDVRGGISVSFPVSAIDREKRRTYLAIAGTGLLVTVLMLGVFHLLMRGFRLKLEKARSELREAAVTDALTGLHNRKYVLARFDEAVAEAKRSGAPFSCAIIDADNFKRINDELGHQMGDAALVSLAAVMKETLRPYDVVGRYGGEEFLILFPSSPLGAALAACERLRLAVESGLEARTPGLGRRLTISAGLASLGGGVDSTLTILERADSALYRAKAAGKNRCETERR
ncbi:MAG TPA: diguanylate cyclase [Spirochaetia bacterium]|nr:diguanylate cyclase [Spirochaetia bacterium]